MKIIMISGSRNPAGKTASMADALLRGATDAAAPRAGAQCERYFLPELFIRRCRQCDEQGWGECREKGTCVIEDDFANLVEAIRRADAVVVATPVYFSDLSESLRAFLDRLRRTCMHEAGKAKVAGKPAVGICVAGGGGGGAPHCTTSLTRVLATCGFDCVDMIPVRRQNLDAKAAALSAAGRRLAGG